MHLGAFINLVNRSTVHKLIKRTKTSTMESLKGQYKHIEAIMTGKRIYKEVKAKHDLTETGLKNKIDCVTMDQNELYIPNTRKRAPDKHASEVSFTLKDDAVVELSASGSTSSSHEQTLHESCLSGDVNSVRQILNKQKDNKGSNALMLAVSGGHKDLVRVLIEEFQLNVNTSEGLKGKTPLLEACFKGHTDLMRELVVEHGADLSAKDNENNDALIHAVYGGHQDLVRVLIKEYHFNANTSRGINERTPLHQACFIGHTDLVRELVVEHGADLSAKDIYCRDAFMCAVSGGHQYLVRLLIKEFNLNANMSREKNGCTPLLEACYRGHTDLVRELIVEHGADVNAHDYDGDDALMNAVTGGHQDLVRVLIKEFNFNANTSRGSDGRTVLHEACFSGHIDLVRELVVEHGADLSAKDNDKNDALIIAVYGGHQDLVRVLIKEFHFNANTSRGRNGTTPLLEACFKDHTDLVRELVVEHGADLSAKDLYSRDAFMCAVIGGHQDLVRVLIKEFHFNANTSRGRNGTTPLLLACFKGHTDLVRELVVEHGADLSAKDIYCRDAFMCAVSGGHQYLVRVLIKEFNLNTNMSRGNNGCTPLLEACYRGHTDLVRELIVEHGADVDAHDHDGDDALMNAVTGGHQDLVRVLIKEFNFNANTSRGSDGRTVLHEACFKGHTDLMRELVTEHGADLGAKDNDNNDALIIAVSGGHQDLVRVLIKEFHFNANTSRGRNGTTPLLEACFKGHTDLVRELVVEHGADLSAKDLYCRDAFMCAVIGGHQYLVRVLIKEFNLNANMSREKNGCTPLLEACYRGHTDLVRELIVEHGADVDAHDHDGGDALMNAVTGGHQDLVRVLMKEFHFNANTSRGRNGTTPLLEACFKGHTDLVRELVVEHEADLSAKDIYCRDAFMCAVIGGHQYLVRLLIKEFNLNANMSRGNNGCAPLLEACYRGHTDLVRELIVEHGADVDAHDHDGDDALMNAVTGGHQDLVRVLIKEFNFNANTSRGSDGRTVLHEACFKGHTDLMRELVTEHGADLGAKDNDNNDALIIAVSGGHQDLVRVLIKEFHFNANTSRGRNGTTPLLEACFKGHTDLVRELVVEHGADLSAKDIYCRDAFMCAVIGGHQYLVRLLIKEFNLNANMSRGNNGCTPLLEACYRGHTDLVRELIVEHGADVDAHDYDGDDALMNAVTGGHQDLVRVLIKEFNFNANTSRGSDGRTVLHEACFKGHTDLMRELVTEHGADLGAKDNDNNDALIIAVSGGHQDLVRVLIKEFHFNANTSRGLNGRTPLHQACYKGCTDLVRELVAEHGADVDAHDYDGNNALMYAVIGNHPDIAELSINEFGFDVNAGNFYGCTPLLMALYHNHIDIAMDLIYRFEADVNAQDMYGHNCLMYAAQGGSLTAARYLLTVCGFDMNARGHCGETALLVACYYGHISFVTYLFAESEHSLDLKAEDEHGNNALMYAVDGCQEAAVRFLMEEYAFDVISSNDALQTPALLASMEGNVGLLNILVKELGASLLCEDENGETVFSIAVSEGQQNIVDFLVSEFFNDVEKWLAANYYAYYPVLIPNAVLTQ